MGHKNRIVYLYKSECPQTKEQTIFSTPQVLIYLERERERGGGGAGEREKGERYIVAEGKEREEVFYKFNLRESGRARHRKIDR